MRTSILALPLLALFALGCPDPPDDLVTTAPDAGQGGPGQPGDGQPVPPPPDGDGDPNSGEAGPPSDDGPGLAPPGEPGALPSFADLIDGDTVTISGTVTGAEGAQVDFLVIVEEGGVERPSVLHVEPAEDGTFSVEAPATYPDPIYLSAVVDAGGDGPTPDDTEGGLAEPITLAGEDVAVTIDVTVMPEWLDALRSAAPDAGAAEPMDNPAEIPPDDGPPTDAPPSEGTEEGGEAPAPPDGEAPPEGEPPPE